MRALLERAEQCIDQLEDSQLWYRGQPGDNAIGNLILHLVGNLRQWVLSGIDGQPDNRDRPAEFGARSGKSKAELVGLLREVIEESCRVIDRLSPERILESKHIQGTDTTIAYALVMAVSHLGLHVGQMQFIAKTLLKEKYQVAWIPPERKLR
jgi:hypothetical protein